MSIGTRADGSLVLRRVVAFVLDLLVVAGAAWVAAGRVARSRGWRALAAGAVAAPGGLAYHALLEGATGRTAGKAAAGIAVRDVGGGPPSFGQAAVRTALRLVDWLPAGYIVGFVAMAVTDRTRRLGDLAAGTVVVREPPADEGPSNVDVHPRRDRR